MARTILALLALVVLASGMAAQIPIAPSNKANFTDKDAFQLALNLEYLEAEFYLYSVYGFGVEGVDANLTGGGPKSTGGRIAALSKEIRAIAEELALQEIGHIRIIREFLGNETIARPAIDIGSSWKTLFAAATDNLTTSYDPYANDLQWLLAAYALPYVGLTAYVGTNPNLLSTDAKALLAGVLGVEGGQDALLRTVLWLRQKDLATSLRLPVLYFTGAISDVRDKLDKDGRNNDENIEVFPALGAENKTSTNILAANLDSLSFARNAYETIRIIYGTGDSAVPGGFFPKGVNGNIGDFYLKNHVNATTP